jgi:hypothetical protein
MQLKQLLVEDTQVAHGWVQASQVSPMVFAKKPAAQVFF